MLMPVFYFVLLHEGNWCVRLDHDDIVDSFRDKTSAIEAARKMARVRWEDFGRRGGVKIQDETGWVDDVMFGTDGLITT